MLNTTLKLTRSDRYHISINPLPVFLCIAILRTVRNVYTHTGFHATCMRTQIGGVVCRSPLIAIATYEREHSIPRNYINCSMSVLPQPVCHPNVFSFRDGGVA